MKSTGVSCVPKFGLLVFLGHPNIKALTRVVYYLHYMKYLLVLPVLCVWRVRIMCIIFIVCITCMTCMTCMTCITPITYYLYHLYHLYHFYYLIYWIMEKTSITDWLTQEMRAHLKMKKKPSKKAKIRLIIIGTHAKHN